MPEDIPFHPLDPAHYLDPHERLTQLRRTCPVSVPAPWLIFVARDEDVRAALRDVDTFSNTGSLVFDDESDDPPTILQLDPPEHTRVRRLQTHMSPRMVARAAPAIRHVAEQLVERFRMHDHADLMAEFAFLLPVFVVPDLVGLPEADRAKFCEWVMDIKDRLPIEYRGIESWTRFNAYMRDLIADRRASQTLRDDMLTHLVVAERDGAQLTDDEIRMAMFQLIGGGTNAISFLIGNLVYELLRREGCWDQLREQPSLIPSAVEESLRRDPPAPWVLRRCRRETAIAGTPVREGKSVMLSLASANRDEAIWDAPHAFLLDRRRANRTHLAFGHGPHFCLGAPLARAEASIAMEVLVAAFPTLRLAPGFAYHGVEAAMLHGPKRLDVVW